MSNIDRKALIGYVESIGEKIDKVKAIKDDEVKDDSKGVGTNQFRNLANVCRGCDVYEEVKLLVKYKIAKEKPNQSWKIEKNGKSIGAVVLEYMDVVRRHYDDDTVMEALSLFFGYMYQYARVWRAENKVEYNNGGNNYSRDNYRKDFNKNRR